jgi:Kef-type K+ transport system membrane component KefB
MAAYVAGLGLALAMAAILDGWGLVTAPALVAVALSATGLGLVIPLLRDARLLETPAGRLVAAAASVAEFSAVVVLALGFGEGHSPGVSVALLGSLVILTVVVTAAGRRLGARGAVTALVDRLSGGASQLRVRLSVALVVGFAALAQRLDLEVVLGAFFAGGILNVLDHGMRDREFRGRLDGVGYGFLIPIFFIVTGLQFDLDALLSSASSIVLVPGFALLFLLVRGLPALVLYRGDLELGERRALALMSASALPLIVAITEVAVEAGNLSEQDAVALVGAGMVSLLVYPLVATALIPRES